MAGTAELPARRRLLLLGDGQWAAVALRHLAAHHEVAAVVERRRPTSDDLRQACRTSGLSPLGLVDVNSAEAMAWIRSLAPDLLLSVSYDQLFASALLAAGMPPVLNLHAGHPGRCRGRAVLCWQLLEGATEVDLAVMRVSRRIDAGPLLALRRVALPPQGDYGQALAAVCGELPSLLDEGLVALELGRQLPVDGAGRPVYYPRRREGDEWIDWAAETGSIVRLVRALAPPNCQARTRWGERVLLVGAAGPCADFPGKAAGIPGAVIGRDRRLGLLVKTGDGAAWISGLATEDGLPQPLAGLPLSARLGGGGVSELERLRRRVALLEERLAALEGMPRSLVMGGAA
jgi:methionyl-tRNA formyltransferase